MKGWIAVIEDYYDDRTTKVSGKVHYVQADAIAEAEAELRKDGRGGLGGMSAETWVVET